jgi:hypothetical protein
MSYVDKQELLGHDGQGLGEMAVFATDFATDSRLCAIQLTPGSQINRFVCA